LADDGVDGTGLGVLGHDRGQLAVEGLGVHAAFSGDDGIACLDCVVEAEKVEEVLGAVDSAASEPAADEAEPTCGSGSGFGG
jgi:hypothetical protein